MDIQGWFLLGLTGLISFAVQGTLKSVFQHHSSKALFLWCLAIFMVHLSHLYMTTGKTIALARWPISAKISILWCVFFFKIMKVCWILSNAFCIRWDDHVDFSFILLLWCNIFLCWPPLYWRNESHLGMVYNSFNVLLNSVCSYFVEEFCINIHKGHWSVVWFFFPLVVSLSDFGIRVMLVLQNQWGEIWWNSPVKPAGHRLFFFFKFKIYLF